jgi:YesN/AraC family two-component response regulator
VAMPSFLSPLFLATAISVICVIFILSVYLGKRRTGRHRDTKKIQVPVYDDAVQLSKILQYVENHYQDPLLSLERASLELKIRKSIISRLLKKELDLTYSEYLVQFRLSKSLIDLYKNNRNLNEIAFKAGFRSVSYFFQSFKNLYGKSPKEYLGSRLTLTPADRA